MENDKIYSVEEAREVLARFRAGFPNIAEWMDRQKMVYLGSGCFVHPRTANAILTDELLAFDDLLKRTKSDPTPEFLEKVFKAVDETTES